MSNTEVTKHAFYFQIHDIKPVFNVSWYYFRYDIFIFIWVIVYLSSLDVSRA